MARKKTCRRGTNPWDVGSVANDGSNSSDSEEEPGDEDEPDSSSGGGKQPLNPRKGPFGPGKVFSPDREGVWLPQYDAGSTTVADEACGSAYEESSEGDENEVQQDAGAELGDEEEEEEKESEAKVDEVKQGTVREGEAQRLKPVNPRTDEDYSSVADSPCGSADEEDSEGEKNEEQQDAFTELGDQEEEEEMESETNEDKTKQGTERENEARGDKEQGDEKPNQDEEAVENDFQPKIHDELVFLQVPTALIVTDCDKPSGDCQLTVQSADVNFRKASQPRMTCTDATENVVTQYLNGKMSPDFDKYVLLIHNLDKGENSENKSSGLTLKNIWGKGESELVVAPLTMERVSGALSILESIIPELSTDDASHEDDLSKCLKLLLKGIGKFYEYLKTRREDLDYLADVCRKLTDKAFANHAADGIPLWEKEVWLEDENLMKDDVFLMRYIQINLPRVIGIGASIIGSIHRSVGFLLLNMGTDMTKPPDQCKKTEFFKKQKMNFQMVSLCFCILDDNYSDEESLESILSKYKEFSMKLQETHSRASEHGPRDTIYHLLNHFLETYNQKNYSRLFDNPKNLPDREKIVDCFQNEFVPTLCDTFKNKKYAHDLQFGSWSVERKAILESKQRLIPELGKTIYCELHALPFVGSNAKHFGNTYNESRKKGFNACTPTFPNSHKSPLGTFDFLMILLIWFATLSEEASNLIIQKLANTQYSDKQTRAANAQEVTDHISMILTNVMNILYFASRLGLAYNLRATKELDILLRQYILGIQALVDGFEYLSSHGENSEKLINEMKKIVIPRCSEFERSIMTDAKFQNKRLLDLAIRKKFDPFGINSEPNFTRLYAHLKHDKERPYFAMSGEPDAIADSTIRDFFDTPAETLLKSKHWTERLPDILSWENFLSSTVESDSRMFDDFRLGESRRAKKNVENEFDKIQKDSAENRNNWNNASLITLIEKLSGDVASVVEKFPAVLDSIRKRDFCFDAVENESVKKQKTREKHNEAVRALISGLPLGLLPEHLNELLSLATEFSNLQKQENGEDSQIPKSANKSGDTFAENQANGGKSAGDQDFSMDTNAIGAACYRADRCTYCEQEEEFPQLEECECSDCVRKFHSECLDKKRSCFGHLLPSSPDEEYAGKLSRNICKSCLDELLEETCCSATAGTCVLLLSWTFLESNVEYQSEIYGKVQCSHCNKLAHFQCSFEQHQGEYVCGLCASNTIQDF